MDHIEEFITGDGTKSFYNKVFNDIYHSRVGAYKEALEKFVLPSKILENLHNKTVINVFDVCFGPGYNSKVLLTEIFKRDPLKKISIVAVENDPSILLKSIDISFDGYPDNLKAFFDRFLHKVYYTTISNRYTGDDFFYHEENNISLKFFVNDVRQIVDKLNSSFDLIFHDPFSPQKLPSLWSTQLFKALYLLLKDNGKLITYSSSPAVRGGLIKAGFFTGNTDPVGRVSPGTIAVKDPKLIDNLLSFKEKELLNSRAGIPFEDPNLNWSDKKILLYRKEQQNISSLKAASSLRKDLYN
jgi:tRNA U34 5-methylaminomethyl-2-thiouridine-forming methyltransferase MnmC